MRSKIGENHVPTVNNGAAVPIYSFLSRMSHDIRTPMNAIIGLSTLALNDDTLGEKTRDYLMKIGDNAQHLLGLINQIMDMSRIESGQMTLRREEFHFKAMLEQLSSTAASLCGEKGLSCECRFLSPVDEYYCGDEAKLKEVLSHILGNAVKLTDAPGSVTMSVARTTVFDDQTTLIFRIRDTGVGIGKERLQKVFDAFSWEDNGRAIKEGAGLGLSITKNLVEMMDGSISVESEEGAGTEFSVTVTLKNCAQKAVVETEALIDIHDMYVLVVDDNLNSAKYTKSVLDRVGIRSDICTSGPDALRMIELQHGRHQPYHLVLMDCNMPDMDGLEATKAIRALDREDAGTIPIIALTANAFVEDVKYSLQAGMNAHLNKPVEPEQLFQVMGELLFVAEQK